jgi:hypothetical protein
MPFFLVADHPGTERGRVQIWATPYPSREAALAHAQRIAGPCMVIEARNLLGVIQQVRASQASDSPPPAAG